MPDTDEPAWYQVGASLPKKACTILLSERTKQSWCCYYNSVLSPWLSTLPHANYLYFQAEEKSADGTKVMFEVL